MKKILTLDDLYKFCLENKFEHFSSKENGGAPLVVQTLAQFEANEDEEPINGLYPVKLKSCHTKLNRNGSYISKEVMEEALPTIYNRPILAHIIETQDGGHDFDSHNVEFVDDDYNDGEGQRVYYIEKPIGIVPESGNAHLEYDVDEDKDYVIVNGYIFTEYSNGGYEIIKSKGGTKVSVELSVEEMSFNTKEKYLSIDKFTFSGITCLGEHVECGMKGSELTVDSFSEANNSFFAKANELVEALDKAITAVSEFNISNNSKEGGNDSVKLDELLKKYSKTKEDLTFEVEGLTDEELEAKFEETFGASSEETFEGEDDNVDDDAVVANADNDDEEDINDDEDTDEDDEPEDQSTGKKKRAYDIDEDNNLHFVISHDDIRSALYHLLWEVEDEDEKYYMINDVYDDYFIYGTYDETIIYRQGYSKDDEANTVVFNGERVEIFKEYLTAEEKAEIKSLRDQNVQLLNELSGYQNQKKTEILEDKSYSEIAESEEFVALKNSVAEYSIEEVQTKADLLLAKFIKENGVFSHERKQNKVSFGISQKDSKETKKPYGNLFD